MGLDMYLEGHKQFLQNWKQPEQDPKEDGFRIKGKTLDLGYWRKHPNLHGFIVQAFAGGVDECQEINLSAQDIRNIISAVKGERLPETKGFFFGASDGSERDEDVKIFERALLWLEKVDTPAFEKTETDIGTIVKISDKPLQDEWRSVVYRASW